MSLKQLAMRLFVVLAFGLGFGVALLVYLFDFFSYAATNPYTSTTAILIALLGALIGMAGWRAVNYPKQRTLRQVFKFGLSAYLGLVAGLTVPAFVSNPAWQSSQSSESSAPSVISEGQNLTGWMPTIFRLEGSGPLSTVTEVVGALDIHKEQFDYFLLSPTEGLLPQPDCDQSSFASSPTALNDNEPNEGLETGVDEGSTSCEWVDIALWLSRNPSKHLVVDVTDQSVEGLEAIAKYFPEVVSQVVAQVSDLEWRDKAISQGFGGVMVTLAGSGSLDDFVSVPWHEADFFAVSIPFEDLPSLEFARLEGVPVYAEVVNELERLPEIRQMGASGVVTDVISTRLP